MVAQRTRADSLREYLSGASSDGGIQADPLLSLGSFRSSTEALSLGIEIEDALFHVTILYAGGANLQGTGILYALDQFTLAWQAPGDTTYGPPANFNGVDEVQAVEGSTPGKYLRVMATTPFVPGQSTITLSYLVDNVFGMSDLTIADAAAGTDEYRATVVKNESVRSITSFCRWLATLGTPQTSNASILAATGSGALSTTGLFADWPASGWCQIKSSGGTLKEVVYYSLRTASTLSVPTAGRGLFATTSQAGSITDVLYPVPGVVVGMDPSGMSSGGSIQQVANVHTAPAGVTWNKGLSAGTGIQIGSLSAGQQVGIWLWRQVPPGVVASPFLLTELVSGWNAF